MAKTYEAVIIGGGFFGCSLALRLRQSGQSVLLLEKEADLLQRASYANQARVHGGYHYPRSLLTALRSRVNLPDFVRDYQECVVDDFDKYYAIARDFSKVSAAQFLEFCRRIGAPIEPAPANIRLLFNFQHIEEVYKVREFAFDAAKLRQRMERDLEANGVEWQLGAEVDRVGSSDDGLNVKYRLPEGEQRVTAQRVYNCTYSQINRINARSGLPLIPLKHELAEIALVEVPEVLQNLGITVMCGPFFSIMPFPARGLHSFSHVRYTPHTEWRDGEGDWDQVHQRLRDHRPPSAFGKMLADARRYVPGLDGIRQRDSLFEVKTVLPKSEADDSRPILFRPDHGLPGYSCLMGGKIDNVYDVLKELDSNEL